MPGFKDFALETLSDEKGSADTSVSGSLFLALVIICSLVFVLYLFESGLVDQIFQLLIRTMLTTRAT